MNLISQHVAPIDIACLLQIVGVLHVVFQEGASQVLVQVSVQAVGHSSETQLSVQSPEYAGATGHVGVYAGDAVHVLV